MAGWFKLAMRATGVEYGKGLKLNGTPVIFNKRGATLRIGDGVTVNSSFLSNLVGLYQRTIIVTREPGAVIEIGDGVGISGATIYARRGICIGANTLVGGNAKIIDNDFHPLDAEARHELAKGGRGEAAGDLIPTREIRIGRDCFIGCNAIVLKGTELGDGCVVGAGAVVSGRFPAGSVIAGNPARVVKTLEYHSNNPGR